MQEQNVEQSRSRSLSHRPTWKVRLGLLGGTLLLVVVAASAALNQMASTAPRRVHGAAAHLAWYVQDGRLQADMHTLGSMCRYIVATRR